MNAALGVVIPAFNSAETIYDALASCDGVECVAEIVVVDDGSEDATGPIVRAYAAEMDRRVRLVTQPNAGSARARLHGAESLGTQFVLFLDADDVLLTGGAEILMAAISKDEGLTAVAGRARYLSADGTRLGWVSGQLYEPIDLPAVLMRRYSPFPPAACVLRRDEAMAALANVIGDSGNPSYPEDYHFLIELLYRNGKVGTVTDVVAGIRVSFHSKTAGNEARTFAYATRIAVERWEAIFGKPYPRTTIEAPIVTHLKRQFIRQHANGQWLRLGWTLLRLAVVAPRETARRVVARVRRQE